MLLVLFLAYQNLTENIEYINERKCRHTETTVQSKWLLPARLRSKLDSHPIGRNLYVTEIAFYPEHSLPEKGSAQEQSRLFTYLLCRWLGLV